jgi:hypothetical protein
MYLVVIFVIILLRFYAVRNEEGVAPMQAEAPIKELTHEEVEAALPKLRQDAAEAEARLHAAMERLARTNEVATYVEVRNDHLAVNARAMGGKAFKKWLGTLKIPLEHVQSAQSDPDIEHELWRGWRIPGVRIPGVRFYDVHGHRDKTIVIHLKNENNDRLIVEVQDPVEVVTKINDALDAARRS